MTDLHFFSRHVDMRGQQRGFKHEHLELASRFGTEVRGGFVFLEQDRARLREQIRRKLEIEADPFRNVQLQELRRLVNNMPENLFVGVTNGVVQTAYRMSAARLRCRLYR